MWNFLVISNAVAYILTVFFFLVGTLRYCVRTLVSELNNIELYTSNIIFLDVVACVVVHFYCLMFVYMRQREDEEVK